VLQNRSWVGFDCTPVTTNIGGEDAFGENSAAGVQIMSDVAGVLNRTFGIVNYAYRVKLAEEKHLRIGISLAISSDRLDNKNLSNDEVLDPMINSSVKKSTQFDGNIGMVYQTKKITLGASLFRLQENLQNSSVSNLATGQLAAYYNITISSDGKTNLNPVMMLRFYKNTTSVFDFGAQFDYNNLLNVMMVYQTSGNVRTGAGLRLKDIAALNLFYNTNIKVVNASSQQYEIGLGFNLNKK
jgi:type IX secretion system PorP/SprF family membrane protein